VTNKITLTTRFRGRYYIKKRYTEKATLPMWFVASARETIGAVAADDVYKIGAPARSYLTATPKLLHGGLVMKLYSLVDVLAVARRKHVEDPHTITFDSLCDVSSSLGISVAGVDKYEMKRRVAAALATMRVLGAPSVFMTMTV